MWVYFIIFLPFFSSNWIGFSQLAGSIPLPTYHNLNIILLATNRKQFKYFILSSSHRLSHGLQTLTAIDPIYWTRITCNFPRQYPTIFPLLIKNNFKNHVNKTHIFFNFIIKYVSLPFSSFNTLFFSPQTYIWIWRDVEFIFLVIFDNKTLTSGAGWGIKNKLLFEDFCFNFVACFKISSNPIIWVRLAYSKEDY